MSTTFPVTLPDFVPEDRWNVEEQPDGTYTSTTATYDYLIDAGDATEAELRLLAYIEHDISDRLRGVVATARPGGTDGRWRVTLVVQGTFNVPTRAPIPADNTRSPQTGD